MVTYDPRQLCDAFFEASTHAAGFERTFSVPPLRMCTFILVSKYLQKYTLTSQKEQDFSSEPSRMFTNWLAETKGKYNRAGYYL